jgi:hypothetical protein
MTQIVTGMHFALSGLTPWSVALGSFGAVRAVALETARVLLDAGTARLNNSVL